MRPICYRQGTRRAEPAAALAGGGRLCPEMTTQQSEQPHPDARPRPRSRPRRDPERARRIVAAAVELIRESGVGVVTHRAVAARAGVPLGSTTYHFATIDDILEQALEQAISEFEQRARDWFGGEGGKLDPAAAIVGFFLQERDAKEGRLVKSDFDLYISALSRPRLRPLASRWSKTVVDAYAALVPHVAAVAINGLLESYEIRSVVEDQSLDPAALRIIEAQITALIAVKPTA